MRLAKSFRNTSILLIGFGVLYLILDTLLFIRGASTLPVYASELVVGAALVATGLVGTQCYKKPQLVQSCFIMGIATFVLAAIVVAIGIAASRYSLFMLGLVGLPVFYTIEANKLKQAMSKGQGSNASEK